MQRSVWIGFSCTLNLRSCLYNTCKAAIKLPLDASTIFQLSSNPSHKLLSSGCIFIKINFRLWLLYDNGVGRSAGRTHPILLEKNYLRKFKGVFNKLVNAPLFSYSLFAFCFFAFLCIACFLFVFEIFSAVRTCVLAYRLLRLWLVYDVLCKKSYLKILQTIKTSTLQKFEKNAIVFLNLTSAVLFIFWSCCHLSKIYESDAAASIFRFNIFCLETDILSLICFPNCHPFNHTKCIS